MDIQHVSIPRPPGMESREWAREFYVSLLGMEEIPVPRSIQHLDLIWFQVGGRELHCFSEEPIDDPSGRHFCLMVENLEALRARLSTAGYAPWGAQEIPGRPRFFCHDPFKNTIEFTTIEGHYLDLEESDE